MGGPHKQRTNKGSTRHCYSYNMGRSGEYMSHMHPSISTESKVRSMVVSKLNSLRKHVKALKRKVKRCKTRPLETCTTRALRILKTNTELKS